MGLLDRLLGRPDQPDERDPDAIAIERYRYLLRTAPPETIEQAHREAFEQLTPDQRAQVLAQLAQDVPAAEQPGSDDPAALARMATRAEMRRPGTLESRLGGQPSGAGGLGGGMGMGGLVAGSLFASLAGAFVGTAIADAMFDMSDGGGTGDLDAGGEGSEGGDVAADGGLDQGGFDDGGDAGGGDFGGGDFGGGDFGGFGGDF